MEIHLSRVQEREFGDYRLTQGKTCCNALLPAEDERDQRQADAGVEGEWHSEHLSLKNFFERQIHRLLGSPMVETVRFI